MANQIHVDLVAVEEAVWSGDADIVIAKTVEGELGILHGHMPLLGQLAEPSQVRIRQSGGDQLIFDVRHRSVVFARSDQALQNYAIAALGVGEEMVLTSPATNRLPYMPRPNVPAA